VSSTAVPPGRQPSRGAMSPAIASIAATRCRLSVVPYATENCSSVVYGNAGNARIDSAICSGVP
jgi:hypothetical protein